ncbi:MAG: AAA family ATPase [Gammaproteobacteria bacterium]|nr:AAA family ATPase [Gammaproteobacteria bacterium]
MYTSFYGFRERPFSLLPDPDFLFLSKEHSVALAVLEYALSGGIGCAVITGEIGCGKTTLVRQLLNDSSDDLTIGLISNTHRSFGELLDWVSMAFDLEIRGKRKAELYHNFVNFLVQQYAAGKRTVLIVDEAQNMDAQTLEELRLLSNVNADKDQVLQLVLVGQPELRDTLRRPDLVQMAQRVGVNYHLAPLLPEEVPTYIAHRLKMAGGDENLFDADACSLVAQHSGGVPRIINTLCDTSLVFGFATEQTRVNANLVAEVIRDTARNSLLSVFSGDLDVLPTSRKSHT